MLIFDDFKNILEGVSVYEKYLIGKCVFHDDNKPSLLVFKDGWFRCLGCNRAGTWQTLWNRANGQPVQVHTEIKTDWKGPDIDRSSDEIAYQAHEDLLNFPSLGWYLNMRGLEGRIEQAMLGYWNGWYTIPVFSRSRDFLNVVYRAAPHIQQSQGLRYWYQGTPYLYVPDWKLVNDHKYIVVTYGIFDALTLADMRIPAASPSNGKDSFKVEWLEELRRVTYIIPDQDEEETARKHAKGLGWRGNVVYMDWTERCKDINDFVSKGKRKELEAQLNERIE